MSLKMKAVAPVVSALALVFMVGATNVGSAKEVAGQQNAVNCYEGDAMDKGLKEQFNMEVKETGDHPKWRLKLYANKAGDWALAGEPKDNSFIQGATPDMKLSCELESPTKGGYPDRVRQLPWYKKFFAAPGAGV